MNTRPLTSNESSNLAILNAAGLTSALLFVTATAIHKGILDATEPMRLMFLESGVHDYSQQTKGPNSKRLCDAIVLKNDGPHDTTVSLYRPITKKGDPRMWFYGLGEDARPDDVYAVFIIKRKIHALNLSRANVSSSAGIANFLLPLKNVAQQISNELLSKLRALSAAGPIKAVCKGDTAVGRSIEFALGIPINSKRTPDYKGIEIKSGRSTIISKETRATLFACVPDWNLSALKSSDEILSRYGYTREGDFKLYCTVSTQKINSQGLQFEIEDAIRWLREIARRAPDEQVAVWPLAKLENRLAEKHKETFWVKAKSEVRSGGEWFHLESVTHTRHPNIPQFERLLADGTVTMDHLIKRLASGRAHEKGPLFKIHRQKIAELFLGKPEFYSLNG